MPPARLVVGKDAPDRLVAAPVAAHALERLRDGLLLRPRAERARQLQPEVGGRAADVAFGKPQAQHVLGAEGADADARDDP